MHSSRHKPSNRRQAYLALVSKVEGGLRDAYARRYEAGVETQASLAEKLGVNRSVVNRRLSGRQNMTLETVADMAWALGHCVSVEIYDPADRPSNEPRIVPDHRVWLSSRTLTATAGTGKSGTLLFSAVSE